MYQPVSTNEEREIFERMYTESFSEKNYETIESYKGERMSYLVKNELGEYVGTFEFVKYNPSFDSTLINPFLFLEHSILLNVPLDDIWEIDKVTVKVSERKNGSLKRIIQSLFDVVNEHNIDFLIAEMNPIFCRALKVEFKIELLKLSGIMRTSKYPYIPIIIPVKSQQRYVDNYIEKAVID